MLLGTILILLINALFIIGVYSICRYELNSLGKPTGLILHRVGYLSEKYLGDFTSKMLFNCVVCMSSFWGTAFFCIFQSKYIEIVGYHILFDWIIYILCLAGINSIYARYID